MCTNLIYLIFFTFLSAFKGVRLLPLAKRDSCDSYQLPTGDRPRLHDLRQTPLDHRLPVNVALSRGFFTANLSLTTPSPGFSASGFLAFRTLGLLPRGLGSRRVPAAGYRANLQMEICRHWAK